MPQTLIFRVASRLLAAALCVAATTLTAQADETTRRAKAEEMMQLTKTDSMMEQQLGALRDRVKELAQQQAGGGTLSASQKTLTDTYLKQVQGVMDDEVGWTKLRPLIIQSYADSFTEADLDGIVAFYKTPAGQALVAKTPELSGKTMTLVQDRIKDMQPKLAQMTEEYTTKMKAAAPAPAAAPSLAAPPPAAAPKAAPAK